MSAASKDLDVVVVGAGLAGLRAADLMSRAGVRVRVLEARGRVGGRTCSTSIGGARFDLGAQWVGPGQRRMLSLIKELRLETFPTWYQGTKILEVRGKVSTYRSAIPSLSLPALLELQWLLLRVNRMTDRVRAEAPMDDPRQLAWDRMSLARFADAHIRSRSVRGTFDAAVRVVFGAELEEISLLHFLAYSRAGGGFLKLVEIEDAAQQERLVEGAQEVANRLAKRVSVTLESPVHRVEHGAAGVTVHTTQGPVNARFAIFALPPHLAGRVVYDPPLSAARDQLTQRYPMGTTIKLIATYEENFWRRQGFSGEAVCSGGPATVVFDNTSVDGRVPALLAFLVGGPGREWSTRGTAARRAGVLAQLARYFGNRALRPVEVVEKDWSVDPWSGGCPVASPMPGVLSSFGESLCAPIGRLHWAGTETAKVWTGYMEGALESAERVAGELSGRL